MISEAILKSILSSYGRRDNIADIIEKVARVIREKIFGVDYRIFDKTICYYKEVHGQKLSKEDALSRVLNKAHHKTTWYDKPRQSNEDKMHFYQEVHWYPFFQPYKRRFGGLRWVVNLVKHIENASILEYGCGSAVLTEFLIEKFPNLKYTVADIPSVTLDFVKWKKEKYDYQYRILTIGDGKEGIPLKGTYDLIICQDVLEHTVNPLEIVKSFFEHMSPGAVLLIDFINAPGGENLEESFEQREAVKQFLKNNLIGLKEIDKLSLNTGLYIKDV